MNKLNELTESDLAALALDLADRNGPVAVSIALLECAADMFRDKGKVRTAEGCIQISQELREKIDLPRPSTIGVDLFLKAPATDEADRGREFLVAIERAARRVIEREATPGGLIHRAVMEGARHV